MPTHLVDAPSNFDHRVAHATLAMIFAVVLSPTSHGASAQSSAPSVPNAMQGFSQNRDQPIQIDAASLKMRDKKKEATFSGNVKVVQGDTTMTSKDLVAGVLVVVSWNMIEKGLLVALLRNSSKSLMK
jgi:lipopolysaccharide export system protein LptA